MKVPAAIAIALLASSVAALGNGSNTVPFAVGEKLTYQIFWGPFVVGRATLEVANTEPIDGHDCYHLVAKAKTSGLANLLFPVDSVAESWLDCENLFTRQYRENRSEGKHRRHNETHYDYAQKETVVTNQGNGKQKRVALTDNVVDVVSSLYVVRTRKLMLDADEEFVINAGTNYYRVNIHPDQRKSVWVRPLGDVPSLRLEPNPTLSIISENKGHMWFWVSDDSRHLPLVVNTELRLGNAKLVLFSIANAHTATVSNSPLPFVAAHESSGLGD